MPDTEVGKVAQLMAAYDWGAVPVVEGPHSRRPLGIITDRDIVVRLIALGRDARHTPVADAMTKAAVTVDAEADVADAHDRMKRYRLRRLMVTGGDGTCVGLVSLADVASSTSPAEAGAILKEVSQPHTASAPTRR
jgi:CBS domain-containing protein